MLEYSEDDLQKLKDNHEALFTSELQRRSPSQEEIEQANAGRVRPKEWLLGFKNGIEWLKSYLESNTKEG